MRGRQVDVETFARFGELLKYLRRRAQLTQQELGAAVGYSAAQIGRLESGQRLPDVAAVEARFVAALGLRPDDEPVRRLVKLARAAHNPTETEPTTATASTHRVSRQKNLPAQLTPFIGREQEMAEVQRLLATARLVTVTGAGGCGKTRLALQAASAIGETFADGAHFISLGAISDPTLIIPTIAQALSFTESPDQLLFGSLKAFLRDRHMLLLLDNFEQVISAAPLLTELLSACGQLKLLVTSREALRLRGEQEFPLAPLEVFNRRLTPGLLPVETLSQYPGIALFVQRAQASEPDFRLTADNATAVAEVCARLDGLPLALELAAARIKLLPPQAMLALLRESSLALLTSGARDLPARQQTLRDTIQWSYDLLNTDERRSFRALSIFVGGCTLDAAEALVGDWRSKNDDSISQSSVSNLDLVASLVDKNLLRRTKAGSEPRLGMLETIRDFGWSSWYRRMS